MKFNKFDSEWYDAVIIGFIAIVIAFFFLQILRWVT